MNGQKPKKKRQIREVLSAKQKDAGEGAQVVTIRR
jgi:hypothetical protein